MRSIEKDYGYAEKDPGWAPLRYIPTRYVPTE